MRYVLALDQSTSATKALLFDEVGQCLDEEAREHRQSYPQPGWVEHDAEEIWQNTLTVLRAVAERNRSRRDDTVCLSITNQRETIVVFEKSTGQPLHPAIVWQCRRGDPFCSEHREAGRENLVHQRTGLRLDGYFSASKLQWLVRNRPELRERLNSGEALIGTIDTYLIYRLTEGRVFATDSTNASRTLLYDIGKLDWDAELCALWEIPRRALADVRESGASFGETTLNAALSRALEIRGVMGDSQASLFAQRCFDPGMAKATFGTGSSVLLNIGHTLKHSHRGVVTSLAWVHRGQPTYAFEGIIISSAATLTWLRDQLGIMTDFAEMEKLAESLSDCDGVYFVPAFSGLGLPYWQPHARAALLGLSGHSDRRHVVRAALESIAYQLRDALEALRVEADVPLRGLHGDGRPTTNRWLMQFSADITRTDLRVATMSNCSALGAALAGLLGLGVYPSVDALAALPREETRYQPEMPATRAQSLFTGWQNAVGQVLSPLEKRLS